MWLIFALFVFSYLFGLVGTLVAVPLAAAIGVLVRFAMQVYLDSSVYKGSGEVADRRSRRMAEGEAVTMARRASSSSICAHRPALGAEDFLVSRSNQAAADMSTAGPTGRIGPSWWWRRPAPARRISPTSGACSRGRPASKRGRSQKLTWPVRRAQSGRARWSRTCTPASATSASCSIC